jgi:conjugal transfer pilus assembly protein TraU
MSRLPKRSFRGWCLLAAALVMMIGYGSEWANAWDPDQPSLTCQSAFPDLFGDICWKCIFPIRIGGRIILDDDMPDNVDTQNPDDWNPSEYLCTCSHRDIGIYLSFWEPARVIEVVQKPNCFPFLFGLDLGDSLNIYGAAGTRDGSMGKPGEKSFYNVHYISFPLLAILDIITGDYCTDYLSDIALLWFSEIDPTWNDDELALYINPEASLYANPTAQALCPVDCAVASSSFPLNSLFWCAGCWGNMYPLTGNSGLTGSPVRQTSLLASRLLTKLARNLVPPIEYDTSGPYSKCGGIYRPILKKSQYKFSTLFPVSETEGRCCHTLGSSTFIWGDHRNIPGTGEFQIYLMWRKRNCCLKL